jgi:aubergine-like protein
MQAGPEDRLNQPQSEAQKISYPKAPPKNQSLRSDDKIVTLSSNLMKLTFSNPLQKVYIYSIDISPELAKDNYTLQAKIYKTIDPELSKYFIKKTFAGLNLFGSTKDPKNEIIIKETVENKEFTVTFKKVSLLTFEEVFDNQGINQKKKNFVEKLIKDILLSAKNTIRFGSDRMVIQMTQNNIIKGNDNSSIYKGFYTSAQITESGLYLMVLNMNKYVSGKTMYEKIMQIRNENRGLHQSEVREKIEEYIEEHRTVLTSYGSMRAYRIDRIEFEKTPTNTSFNIKTPDGIKTINLYNYYKNQYKIDIKDKNQPLLSAERKIKEKNLLTNGQDNNKTEDIIYLVPELVFITGIENDKGSKGRRQDIISKTKTNPNQRMGEINKIHDLINCDIPKQYKRNGTVITNKSSRQLAQDWGINLGDNISLRGRILHQPTLVFDKNRTVIPRNGNFRTDVTYDGVTITRDNIMYIYNRRDRTDFKRLMGDLFSKANSKGMKIFVNANELYSYGLDRIFNWEDIKRDLDRINFGHKKMVIVFIDNNLERFYTKLKEYLTNVIKVNSQFIESKKLMDRKRAGSIMFNIVEQINIKMGGANFYINLMDDNIIDRSKVYLIIGLESKKVGKDSIDYILTCAYNQKLNRTHTVPRNCKDNKEDKEKTLNELMNEALRGLRESGHAPHPPNYVIIYRQGGNHVQNLKLLEEEVPIFVNYFKTKKEQNQKFKESDTKLTYICCNLKGDLKFFEENSNSGNIKGYQNPQSGLCVDEKVIQKDKYEFFIQPQFVNQGTATPCHYEILYQDYDEKNPDINLSIEKIQNLSFQLSFYYWTWSGAVRVPGVLRLSTTALDYYSRCLNHRLNLEGGIFKTPGFI